MIQLRLLGGAAISADGNALTGTVAHRHRVALLALLARAPAHLMSREKLAAYIWPEAEPEASRNLLRVALHNLRRELGPQSLLSEGQAIRLERALVTADVADFVDACEREEREKAVALYAGPFLDGFHLPDASEFGRWLDSERASLSAMYAAALAGLAESSGQRGDSRSAVHWWRKAAAHDPYDSAIALRLMRALADAGDTAGAVQHARIHKALLAEDLGVPPHHSVAALEQQLSVIEAAYDSVAKPSTTLTEAVAGDAGAMPSPPLVSNGITAEAHGRARDTTAVPVAPPVSSSAATRRVRWRYVIASLGGVATIVMLWFAAPIRRALTSEASPTLDFASGVSRELRPNRVLVLPLDVEADDPRLRTLARMAADWVTRGLQRTGLVEVIDPNTAFRLFTDFDSVGVGSSRLRELGEAARAGILVWGSAYPRDSGVTLHVHVTDARDGRILRTLEPVLAEPDNISAALEELRVRVSGALATVMDERLATIVAASSPPPTFDSYQEFAKGLDLFASQNYPAAFTHFERAARLDSSFAMASFWAIYALSNAQQRERADSVIQALLPRRDQLLPVEQAALDMFAAVQRTDFESALPAARRAAELAPQSSWRYSAGYIAWILGRPGDTVKELAQVDPTRGWAKGFMSYWNILGSALHQIGDYDAQLVTARRGATFLNPHGLGQGRGILTNQLQALAALGRVDELDRLFEGTVAVRFARDTATAGGLATFTGLELRAHGYADASRRYFERCLELTSDARCLYELGRYDEVLARFSSDTSAFATVSAAAARLGRRADAERLLAIKHARFPLPPLVAYRDSFELAAIAALAGDGQRAFVLLQSARSKQEVWRFVHLDAAFDAVRRDPVFARMAGAK